MAVVATAVGSVRPSAASLAVRLARAPREAAAAPLSRGLRPHLFRRSPNVGACNGIALPAVVRRAAFGSTSSPSPSSQEREARSSAEAGEPTAAQKASSEAAEARTLAEAEAQAEPLSPQPDLLESSLPEGLWNRFVQWSYRWLGASFYPKEADICNCGIDKGIIIPRPELIRREAINHGTREWRMQTYGAALYWHVASTRGGTQPSSPDALRGLDVLEVACMRGGGARYLAEVMEPRSYIATDSVAEHVEAARSRHSPWSGLRFEVADAGRLAECYEADSFDVVLCVQAAAQFESFRAFAAGAEQVLRPGGTLLICDAFSRLKCEGVVTALRDAGFEIDVLKDVSRSVHAVGLCKIPAGLSYVTLCARKHKSDM